jgi:hypothetical protein
MANKQFVWVPRHVVRAGGFIDEVVSHSVDPIELQRQEHILARKSQSAKPYKSRSPKWRDSVCCDVSKRFI